MKTGLKSSHRHTLSGRPTTLDPAHYHDLPEVDAAIAALDTRLDKLEASMADVILRITKLEAPPVTPPAPPPVKPPPTPPPPVTPPTNWPWATLQAALDATPSGGTLVATGRTFTAPITITKPVTLVGGTISTGSNVTSVTVKAANVTLDGVTISGPQSADINGHTLERGVVVSTAISYLTVKNCTIGTFGMAGMWLDRVTHLTITGNTITDCGYVGIMVLSGQGGTITGNTIKRIGTSYYTGGSRYPAIGDAGSNAYGIALSYLLTPSIVSTGFTVSGNVVEDVPAWHAYDTHGGTDITFENNISRQSRCAYYMTAGGPGPQRVHVTNNRAEAYSEPAGASSPASVIAVVFVSSRDCSATENAIDSGYPDYNDYPSPGDDRVLNYQDANTNLVVSGNTLL